MRSPGSGVEPVEPGLGGHTPSRAGELRSGDTSARKAAEAVAALMRGRRTPAPTGAGISTDADVPDYRGIGTTPRRPVDYDQLVSDPLWYRWV